MVADKDSSQGLKQLIKKLRREFRRSENKDYYSEKDYKKAERKYIKHSLKGKLETHKEKGRNT